MKILAKPLGVPSPHEITEEKIASSATGKKALALIKEGIDKKLLEYTSIQDCLTRFRNQIKVGTCFGESSSVMIADLVIEKASTIDVICHQLLLHLEAAVQDAVKLKKHHKKIEKKLEGASKKEVKKLKQDKKQMHHDYLVLKDQFDLPLKQLHTQALPEAKEFQKKIHQVALSAIEEQSGYSYKKQHQFSAKQKSKFVSKLKKLQHENKKMAVRMVFRPENQVGHAILLFPDRRLEIYDSQKGLMKAENKKEYRTFIKKLFESHIGKSGGTLDLEVFKG
jgi:hypothetical protein